MFFSMINADVISGLLATQLTAIVGWVSMLPYFKSGPAHGKGAGWSNPYQDMILTP
jgi:hypothetical protein